MTNYKHKCDADRENYQQISICLNDLERTLTELDLWEREPPSNEQLTSVQPFALDMLEPTQWLQWVFIPKIRTMIDQKQSLPKGFEISPYFEQAIHDKNVLKPLLIELNKVDNAFQ